MPNIKSAAKRHRQNLKARERNKAVKTRIKNVTKAVQEAVDEKDSEKAATAVREASSVIDRAARKNVIHWKKAARKISRLSRTVSSIQQS